MVKEILVRKSFCMRVIACTFLIFTVSSLFASETSDSTGTDLKAGFNINLNSNGISSIPAFSLGKPAIIASIGLAKGRFSIDPVLAYGLNAKPWFFDSWLHYMIVDRPVFKLRTGVNFSMYFSDYKLPDEEILKSERYRAYELAAFYYFSAKTSLSLLYWNDNGIEPGTISGHYISLSGERSDIGFGEHGLFSVNFQVFYIGYDGKNDGLFVSSKISFMAKDLPFSVFIQATQAIKSNISPFPGFKWNLGLAYTF